MSDSMENLEHIENRHRTERKELQARIQALKKSIPKGDKTKKKEVTLDISRLERELDLRHENEMEQLKDSKETVPEDVNDTDKVMLNNVKLSKAQKRRDKKAAEDKEREQRIIQQEKENRNGPSILELKSIISKLKEKQLSLFNIAPDGDCLYKAVSHQQHFTRRETLSVAELRDRTASYIRTHKDDFIPFMCDPDSFEMLTDDQFENYCNKIASTKTWGGQLELRALSAILQCPIHVVQATGPDTITQGDEFPGDALVVTYHRHMYGLGEHYNSTQKFVDDVESE